MSRTDLLGELKRLQGCVDKHKRQHRAALHRETLYRAAMVRLLCDANREAAEDAAWELYDNLTAHRDGGSRVWEPTHLTREAVITRWREKHGTRPDTEGSDRPVIESGPWYPPATNAGVVGRPDTEGEQHGLTWQLIHADCTEAGGV